MRIFISVDIEGISGVTTAAETTSGGHDYEIARRWMTADTNAAITAAFEAGATRVLVNDSHGAMNNLLLDELDPRAEVIRGWLKPFGMMQGIDQGWDAAFFVGYHTQAGHGEGVLAHTINGGNFHTVRLNGRPVSETELNAAIAGEFGVPVVLVTGDALLEPTVRSMLEPVRFVAVKTGIARETAQLVHPIRGRQLVHDGALEAMRLAGSARPVQLPAPYRVELEYKNADVAMLASWIPTVERVDGRTVAFTSPTLARAMTTLRVLSRLKTN
jgi:D-amino peptidase